MVRAVWDTCKCLSTSLPYVTLDVFSKANGFLTPNQLILIAKLYEVKGTLNMHEYISTLVLLSSADWKAKAKLLFGLFDFDGSEGLNRDECAILAISVFGGIAKATGQNPVSGKTLVMTIHTAFSQIKSLTEVSFDLFLDHFQSSPLQQSFSVYSKSRDTPKLPPPFFSFHRATVPPLTPVSQSAISRKSSRLSRIDKHPNSFNRLNESSRGLKEPISLPPAIRRRKGLIVDGEQVNKDQARELKAMYERYVSGQSRSSRVLMIPGVSRTTNERLRKALENGEINDFAGFLSALYRRATNTQLDILLKWAGERQTSSRSPLTQLCQNISASKPCFPQSRGVHYLRV